jgi:hypothetical protein
MDVEQQCLASAAYDDCPHSVVERAFAKARQFNLPLQGINERKRGLALPHPPFQWINRCYHGCKSTVT